MKIAIEVGDRRYAVEIEPEHNRGIARIDDREIEFEAVEPEPGVYTFLIDHRVQEVRLVNHQSGPLVEATQGDRKTLLRVFDPKHDRRRSLSDMAEKIELKATMPGRVVAWLRQPGETVSEGDGVVVVEAMKMQNEVRSPKSGRVIELCIKPGLTITTGEVLAVIE